MPCVIVTTDIYAPLDRVFDLARSIDVHMYSTGKTQERAIAGVVRGLIGMGQEVTWEARHFGMKQRLTSKITAFSRPMHFQDTMQKGAFSALQHDHHFEESGDHVVMKDILKFHSPLGLIGSMFDYFYLASYMRRFLTDRNAVVKQIAEGDDWKRFLA